MGKSLGDSIGADITASFYKGKNNRGYNPQDMQIDYYDNNVQEHVNALKDTPKPLRQSGIEEPTLEISLLMDCTSSMQSWIDRAKETLI